MFYSPWQLRTFSRLFDAGALFGYPTESVYGLGCDPWNEVAVERLLALKQRPLEKGVILIAATVEQLAPFISLENRSQWSKLAQPRQRPTTWIVPVSAQTPDWIRGAHDGVAVRLTQFAPAAALCNAANSALVSTSANLAGHPPARNVIAVRQALGDQLDLILGGESGGSQMPSEIRHFGSGKVLRAGG